MGGERLGSGASRSGLGRGALRGGSRWGAAAADNQAGGPPSTQHQSTRMTRAGASAGTGRRRSHSSAAESAAAAAVARINAAEGSARALAAAMSGLGASITLPPPPRVTSSSCLLHQSTAAARLGAALRGGRVAPPRGSEDGGDDGDRRNSSPLGTAGAAAGSRLSRRRLVVMDSPSPSPALATSRPGGQRGGRSGCSLHDDEDDGSEGGSDENETLQQRLEQRMRSGAGAAAGHAAFGRAAGDLLGGVAPGDGETTLLLLQRERRSHQSRLGGAGDRDRGRGEGSFRAGASSSPLAGGGIVRGPAATRPAALWNELRMGSKSAPALSGQQRRGGRGAGSGGGSVEDADVAWRAAELARGLLPRPPRRDQQQQRWSDNIGGSSSPPALSGARARAVLALRTASTLSRQRAEAFYSPASAPLPRPPPPASAPVSAAQRARDELQSAPAPVSAAQRARDELRAVLEPSLRRRGGDGAQRREAELFPDLEEEEGNEEAVPRLPSRSAAAAGLVAEGRPGAGEDDREPPPSQPTAAEGPVVGGRLCMGEGKEGRAPPPSWPLPSLPAAASGAHNFQGHGGVGPPATSAPAACSPPKRRSLAAILSSRSLSLMRPPTATAIPKPEGASVQPQTAARPVASVRPETELPPGTASTRQEAPGTLTLGGRRARNMTRPSYGAGPSELGSPAGSSFGTKPDAGRRQQRTEWELSAHPLGSPAGSSFGAEPDAQQGQQRTECEPRSVHPLGEAASDQHPSSPTGRHCPLGEAGHIHRAPPMQRWNSVVPETPYPPPPGLGMLPEASAPEGPAAMQCSQGTLFPPPPGLGLPLEGLGLVGPWMQRSPGPLVPCLPGAGWLAAGAFWHREQSQAGPLLHQEQSQAGPMLKLQQQHVEAGPFLQEQAGPLQQRQQHVQTCPLWQEPAGSWQHESQQEKACPWRQQEHTKAGPLWQELAGPLSLQQDQPAGPWQHDQQAAGLWQQRQQQEEQHTGPWQQEQQAVLGQWHQQPQAGRWQRQERPQGQGLGQQPQLQDQQPKQKQQQPQTGPWQLAAHEPPAGPIQQAGGGGGDKCDAWWRQDRPSSTGMPLTHCTVDQSPQLPSHHVEPILSLPWEGSGSAALLEPTMPPLLLGALLGVAALESHPPPPMASPSLQLGVSGGGPPPPLARGQPPFPSARGEAPPPLARGETDRQVLSSQGCGQRLRQLLKKPSAAAAAVAASYSQPPPGGSVKDLFLDAVKVVLVPLYRLRDGASGLQLMSTEQYKGVAREASRALRRYIVAEGGTLGIDELQRYVEAATAGGGRVDDDSGGGGGGCRGAVRAIVQEALGLQGLGHLLQ